MHNKSGRWGGVTAMEKGSAGGTECDGDGEGSAGGKKSSAGGERVHWSSPVLPGKESAHHGKEKE